MKKITYSKLRSVGFFAAVLAVILTGCGNKQRLDRLEPLPPAETRGTTANTYTGTTVEFYHYETDPTTASSSTRRPSFGEYDRPQRDLIAERGDTAAVSADTAAMHRETAFVTASVSSEAVTAVSSDQSITQVSEQEPASEETQVCEAELSDETESETEETTETVTSSLTDKYTAMTADTADVIRDRAERDTAARE